MSRRLTRAELMVLLRYDPEDGTFFWKCRPAPKCRVKVGDRAGSCNGKGYWEIQVLGKAYQAHRIAWLFEKGRWPPEELDHINGEPGDNRIRNLREATRGQNQHNRKRRIDISSRYKGVSLHKITGKWQVNIQSGGRRKYLGLYDNEERAHTAYANAAKRLHGKFARS